MVITRNPRTSTIDTGVFKLPLVDGTIGQVMITDGEQNLSFTTVVTGLANIVEDLTPQLGADLDMNTFDILASTATGPAMRDEAPSATNPVFNPNQVNAGTGLGTNSSGAFSAMIHNGAEVFRFNSGGNLSLANVNTVSGASLVNEVPSATNPTLVPDGADLDTGIGTNAVDELSTIAGGVEATRWTEASSGIIQDHQATTGITAFATGGQGSATPLLSSFNDVTIVATAGDSVLAPPASLGRQLWVFNADSTDAMDLFPTSGDDLGAGVDTAISVAAGTGVMFMGIDGTTWRQFI